MSSPIDIDTLPYFNPKIDRRVAIITGGNSGIGFYTVLNLYLHGYVVYIASRSKSRCLKSIKELEYRASQIKLLDQGHPQHSISNLSATSVSGEVNECSLGEVHYLEMDLSNLQSIINAVETFKLKERYLHLLINNAGAMALPYTKTIDDFEIQLQTNFISPFLLTLKLLPILERTSDAFPHIEPRPRVIYLSSFGHQFAFRYFNLKTALDYRPNFILTWIRYGIAKTAGIHFMKMLALRNPKVLCISVHPGLVMNTNVFAYWTNLPIVGIIFWCVFQIFAWVLGVTSEQGALEVIRSSLNPQFSVEENNGKYFGSQGKELQPSKVANNMDYAARTWIWTVHELSKRGFIIPGA
ncbi:hypothetical protein CORT_0A12090 [Candida orthopsilosis Co 90-125]|uniref:NAD(P)-binding protein n=1 Tax=Candida orthopsilosis (strain 90-125) TaxID=1136231 RepID=H8WYW2_CANO9|nr:hypothetical protein CORT_0A12090 [Candida orthopsilosis Co 90-125]CCG21594.1 hypothetical protein CORT_0A12090 [Candida orthopsilosis Co 90-125]